MCDWYTLVSAVVLALVIGGVAGALIIAGRDPYSSGWRDGYEVGKEGAKAPEDEQRIWDIAYDKGYWDGIQEGAPPGMWFVKWEREREALEKEKHC